MDGGRWLQLKEGAMQFLALSGGMMLHLERERERDRKIYVEGESRGAWESEDKGKRKEIGRWKMESPGKLNRYQK